MKREDKNVKEEIKEEEQKGEVRPKKEGLRTFATDIARVVQAREGTVIKSILKESQRKEERKRRITRQAKTNIIFAITGVVLLLIGITFITLVISKRQAVVEEIKTTIPSLIFADTHKEIDITDLSREKILAALKFSLQRDQLEPRTIENLLLTEKIGAGKQLINTKRFFSIIKSAVPGELMDNLNPFFMIGIHARDRNHLFILLQGPSYKKLAPGMRTWEKKMFDNLFELFDIDVGGDNKNLFNKTFEDAVINNKNSRVIRDNQDNIALMYQFINDQIIIITRDINTVREVTNRVIAGKIKR